MLNYSKICSFFQKHRYFCLVAIFIIVFLLGLSALFKNLFIIPALSAFFGAFAAFMLNYLMHIIRDRNMEIATLYECKFKIETINNFIQVSEKTYSDTNKGMVVTGHEIPEIIQSDIMFLLKNGEEGQRVLKKILLAKAAYEQVSTRIKIRNEIILTGTNIRPVEKEILRSTTKTLDDEFVRLPDELNCYANSIEQYIKDHYS